MLPSKILKVQERHKCFTLGKWFLNDYSHMVGKREILDNMFGCLEADFYKFEKRPILSLSEDPSAPWRRPPDRPGSYTAQ